MSEFCEDARSVGHSQRLAPRQSLGAHIPRPKVLLAVAAVLLLLYALLWGYRFVINQLGPFAPLALVVLAAGLLAILGPWLVVHERRQIQHGIARGAEWLWTHAGLHRLFDTMRQRYPRLTRFLVGRLTYGTGTGLALTIGVVIAGVVAWFFTELLIQVASGSPITGADHRIINLVATLRTPGLDRAMLLVTFLGNGQTIIVVAVVALLVTLFARRYQYTVLIILSIVGSSLFFYLIKVLAGRPRPMLEEARIVQGGFSFPSGHATVSATLYGTLAYLLIHGVRNELVKVLIGLASALLVLAVGLSRVYLGVHYPSDVLAGWIAGLFWLVLVATTEHVWQQPPRTSVSRPRAVLAVLGTVLSVAGGVFYLARVYQTIPLPPPPNVTPVAPTVIAADAVPSIVTQLPNHTETLLGAHQEPISLILVGTQDTLERAFRAAGWTEAEKLTLASVKKVILVSLHHQSDPAGPVTPSFVAEEPNTLAFNQPVGTTFEQRHHIRIWRTQVQTTDGQQLWLATASFDKGFELGSATFLPTHQIAPDIDNERDYVVASLQKAAGVQRTVELQFVPPELGHNLAGDPFFTYGKAVIVWFR